MTEATHTPGPWLYSTGAVYRTWPVDSDSYPTVRLALMDREEPHTSPTERDANARLIAAAPDFYAEAEANLDLLDEAALLLADYHVTTSNELIDMAAKLREIIARAKGETT